MKILDELVYQEYSNWLMENEELIKFVENSETSIKNTFEHVLPVVDFLYNELIDAEEFSEEEDGIFQFGFHYLVFKYDEIKYVLENICNNDYKELEKLSKTINLMFHVLEFEQALLENDGTNEEDIEEIIDLEKEVIFYLEKGENAPAELFEKVDKVSHEIFVKANYEFESIESIFAQIAIDLDLD